MRKLHIFLKENKKEENTKKKKKKRKKYSQSSKRSDTRSVNQPTISITQILGIRKEILWQLIQDLKTQKKFLTLELFKVFKVYIY